MLGKIFIFGYIFTLCSTYAFISIPLQKERNPEVKEFLNALVNTSLVNKNNGIHPSTNLHFQTFQYYGKIKVGTPGQRFKVAFQTLNSLVYIPSNMATPSCGPKYHNTFIESSSKTFIPTGNRVQGPPPYTMLQIGLDAVEIDGIAANNQSIALILDGKCDGFVFDGIVGLGFPLQTPSLLATLYNNKMIPQYTVGLRFNRDYKCKDNCGEIVLGGWNNKNVNTKTINYISAAKFPEKQWKIILDKVVIGSQEVNKNVYALLDISTTFIRVPEEDMKKIKYATQITAYNDSVYLIDKSQVKNLPSLTFNIGGRDYTLTGNDYVDTVTNANGLSLVLLTTTKGLLIEPHTWILGDAFIGKYYTILDYNTRQVAFASLNGASSLIPISFLTPFVIISTVLRFWMSHE